MPRRRGELKADDLEEIEEVTTRKNCLNCGRKQTRIVRNGTRTIWGACENTECFRYVNLNLVENWTREEYAVMPPAGREAVAILFITQKAAAGQPTTVPKWIKTGI